MYSEIETVIASNHLSYVNPASSGEVWYSKMFALFYRPVYDDSSAVKYIVWNQDQWVSYDDSQTLAVSFI